MQITSNKTIKFIILSILVYVSVLCLLVIGILLSSIEDIFSGFNLGTISATIFLIIFLFILLANCAFFLRQNTIRDYKIILVYNAVFCIISGIGLMLPGYVLVNDLGIDLSVSYTYFFNKGPVLYAHFSLFNYYVKCFKDDSSNAAIGIMINFIMWTLALILFLCYRKVRIMEAPIDKS